MSLFGTIRPMFAVDYAQTIEPGDGVVLTSMAHPVSDYLIVEETVEIDGVPHPELTLRLDPASLETIEIDIPAPAQPELSYAYSTLEFNDHFGPTARVKLARERAEARWTRKYARRARYRRRQGRPKHKH
jgi:hypothetical protein